MGGLATYRGKRDFAKTGEPEGRARKRRAPGATLGGAFVVHKHAARQLHYDLRLQMDGVLKSWAVPKGPSLDPKVRRLAVHVEDHPLEYGSFEGTIPKKEYGGGTVMVWDAGEWEPIGDAGEGYRRGELKFRLSGRRLHGAWVLVRLKPKPESGDDEGKDWLLIKERDGDARPGAADLGRERDRSVASRRTMRQIAAADGAPQRAALRRAAAPKRLPERRERATPLPASAPLTLATLVKDAPDGDDWVHEIKYDGYRLLARLHRGEVRLLTRNGLDWTARFPDLSEEFARFKVDDALLDGEVVAFDAEGRSDFGGLQRWLSGDADGDLTYIAFDLLHLDGMDTRDLPLLERKEKLAGVLRGRRRRSAVLVRLSEHLTGDGPDVLSEACRLGLEGVVSKRADSAYPGRRTRAWLKSKCRPRQEFVIGGYTDPAGSRTGFGALLVGTPEAGSGLAFAGKVGSGFDGEALDRLSARLRKLGRASSPFDGAVKVQGAHWVTPRLVAEVVFAGWTGDGRLRQPVFKGLREDKPPGRVRAETAAPPPERAEKPASAARGRAEKTAKVAPVKPAPTMLGHASACGSKAGARDDVMVAGVRISHPDRVVYPGRGLSKEDVAEYYEAVADLMVPHLAGRPLTVVRCPEGVADQCFFQKHAGAWLPGRVARVTVPEDKGGMEYPAVATSAALMTMVQLGALEFHIMGSREDHLETPDRLVFDLDPAPDVAWREVVAGARLLRDDLRERGLESLVMTSGGKGLHVVVPLRPEAAWQAVRGFTREVAEGLVERYPQKYTATMSKAKRTGKVFIDHFRNGRAATAVAPYSLRAREGAAVAAPLDWDELGKTRGGAVWTAPRMLASVRLGARAPWAAAAAMDRHRLPRRGS